MLLSEAQERDVATRNTANHDPRTAPLVQRFLSAKSVRRGVTGVISERDFGGWIANSDSIGGALLAWRHCGCFGARCVNSAAVQRHARTNRGTHHLTEGSRFSPRKLCS